MRQKQTRTEAEQANNLFRHLAELEETNGPDVKTSGPATWKEEGTKMAQEQYTANGTPKSGATRVGDIIPKNPWSEIPSIKLTDVDGVDVELRAVRHAVVKSQYDPSGQHAAFFVLLYLIEDGTEYVLLVSQQVLMDKLGKLDELSAFPIVGRFEKNGRYWDLV